MEFPKKNEKNIIRDFENAKEIYSELNIDLEKVLKKMDEVSVSANCWQGDDVSGFEIDEKGLSGGIMATGNFPGKARTPEELRQDASKAFSLLPGKKRFNLHAIYLESNGKFVDRDEIMPEHFQNWLEWAKKENVGLDFNPTFFSHEKSDSGFTLSSPDRNIRDFWIEHAKRCREIAANFAEKLDDISIINYWVPDGMKDLPADRWSPRKRLMESYDEIFAEKIDSRVKEAVESKLFGIGSEEYTVGSSEFYLSYSLTRKILLCMDMGHYHPTETIHGKLSSVLNFMPEVLLHVSRPVRWDSDHVVILNDDLMNLAREIVRGDVLDRVYLATDFFDASINRIGAWGVGLRNVKRAVLSAMLEPVEILKKLELEGKNAEKLALMEECKSLPSGAVWDYYCMKESVPVGADWINEMQKYEKEVLEKRN